MVISDHLCVCTFEGKENLVMSNAMYFSEAYNASILSTGVSPQTGSFQATIKLAEINSGIQCPASFTLNLMVGVSAFSRRSPTSTSYPAQNSSLNIPAIIGTLGQPMRMYCASGAAEELVSSASDTITMRYHRVQDITITRVPIVPMGSEWYVVKYKDGTTEYYDFSGYLDKIVSSAGHTLTFVYDSWGRCTRISGSYGESIVIAYESGSGGYSVTQTVAGEVQVVRVSTQRKRLPPSSIFGPWEYMDYVKTVNLTNSAETISFDYESVIDTEPEYLNMISMPNGMRQSVSYTTINYGMVSGELIKLPAVREWTTFNVRLPYLMDAPSVLPFVVKFSYSENNFTGYKKEAGYTPILGKDNCILHSAYEYSVTEYVNCPGFDVEDYTCERRITRTYNQFHLLINEEEVVTLPASRSSTVYSYPLVPGNIDVQRANFLFWQSSTTTLSDTETRTETEARVVDNFGNVTSYTATSGVKTDNEYYPANSTLLDGCPPALNGMICYLKRTTVSPRADESHDEKVIQAQPPKTQQFTYRQVSGNQYENPIFLPGRHETISPYMVLPAQVTVNTLLISESFYQSRQGSNPLIPDQLVGALTETRVTSSTVTPVVVNAALYTWEIVTQANIKRLKQTVKHTAKSGTAATQERAGGYTISSFSTGDIIEESAPNGAITKYTYNSEGRLTKRQAYADTEYEEVENFTFAFWQYVNKQVGAKNIATREKNGILWTYYLGRDYQPWFIYRRRASSQEPAQMQQSMNYEADGDLISQSVYDQCTDAAGNSINILASETNKIVPNMITTLQADGNSTIEVTYIGKNMKKSAVQGTGKYLLTNYNDFGLVSSIEQKLDGSANSQYLQKNAYDGFGRLIETIDYLGSNSSATEYDTFDRVILEKAITRAKVEIERTAYSYSQHIPSMKLPISMTCTIAGVSSGGNLMQATREYDMFSRLIRQITPGRQLPLTPLTETYEYASLIDELPTKITNARGTVEYTYNATTRLLERMVINSGTGPTTPPITTTTFTYNNTTKNLTAASVMQGSYTQCNYTYRYDPFDRLDRVEAWFVSRSDAHYVVENTYTDLLGLLTVQDISITVSGTSSGADRTNFYYNSIGKLSAAKYTPINKQPVSVSIEYVGASVPSTGNISSIVVSTLNVPASLGTMKLTFEYFNDGSEKSRIYTIGDSEILRVDNTFNDTMTLRSRQVIKPGSPYVYTGFEYSNGQLTNSTVRSLGEAGAADTTLKMNTYELVGLSRFGTIDEARPSAGSRSRTSSYSYSFDRVAAITKTNPSETYSVDYDVNGNVSLDGNQNALRYNALNNLVYFDEYNGGKYDKRTTYYYAPDGKLNRIMSPSGAIVYYIYDGDNLIAEFGQGYRVQYMRVGSILLGRIIIRDSDLTVVELYGTDSSGSILCCYAYASDDHTVTPVKEYFNYSDYGEKEAWPTSPTTFQNN